MSIERGSLKDLEQIVKLNYKIFDGLYESKPYSLEHYKEKLKDKQPVIFVSKLNNEITGNSISFARKNSFYIWILGVSEKHRGKGIGNSLLDKNEQFAQENNYESVSVKVYNVSEKMQQLLKQRGYQIVRVVESKTDPKYTAVQFELNLEEF